MSAEEDRDAVRAVLAGDLEAFAGIVRRWQGPLKELAFRFCRDDGRAEEMAQDAFVTAYRGLGQWRGEAVFSTWLFAVATNVYRSRLRRRELPTVPLEAVAEVARRRVEHVDFESREREAFVRDAVTALPPKYRDAVVLYYFHDMDLQQAAASLGLPEGTVKSHLYRARQLLARHLGPLLAGSPSQEEVA